MSAVRTRRGNREGSFRHRYRVAEDGRVLEDRWEGRVMIAGLGRFSVFARTRDGAGRALRRRIDELEVGIRPPDALLTLGEWLDEWLATSHDRLAARTLESYSDIVRLHLRPTLGTIPLSRLSSGHISRLLATKARDPKLNATTVRYIYAVLRIALGRAVKAGRVSRNVCELVDPPRRANTEIALLTPTQTLALIDTLATSPHECLIVTGLATGLRQSELCGLWWSDIDFDTATLVVRAQLNRGGVTRVEPKRGSRRKVGLPALAVSSLRSHKIRAMERALAERRSFVEDSWVFGSADGRPMQGWTAYRILQRLLGDAGLPRVRFHALRHAFATTLLADGEDLANVSKLLGHRDLATTANVYGHLTDQASRRAADRMDRALRRAR
jgi:integrase